MIRIVGIAAMLAALTGCAPDYNYVVQKIDKDPETGRHFLVCGPAGGPGMVEVTRSEDEARRWRIGQHCVDHQVHAGKPVSASTPPSPASAPPTSP